jgi:hypothetical protein
VRHPRPHATTPARRGSFEGACRLFNRLETNPVGREAIDERRHVLTVAALPPSTGYSVVARDEDQLMVVVEDGP